MTKPHEHFNYIRADEVAECWDGIPDDLYRALWGIVAHQKAIPNLEDSGPADHIGHENLAHHWHRLNDEQRQLLNKLAATLYPPEAS
jgi:hypothetical protein